MEKSATVRRSFAVAVGQVAKRAPEPRVAKLVADAVALHRDPGASHPPPLRPVPQSPGVCVLCEWECVCVFACTCARASADACLFCFKGAWEWGGGPAQAAAQRHSWVTRYIVDWECHCLSAWVGKEKFRGGHGSCQIGYGVAYPALPRSRGFKFHLVASGTFSLDLTFIDDPQYFKNSHHCTQW